MNMEDKKDNQYDLEFTGERYIPNDDNNSEIFMQHIQRYIVAKDLCKNKKVLDIAMALEGMPRQASTHACRSRYNERSCGYLCTFICS